MVIVVLGMHGSGTSLVAGMLMKMGIHMGPDTGGRVKDYLTFEDSDFMRLNIAILKEAGGNWKKPPGKERVLAMADREEFRRRIPALVAAREALGLTWGWKDPRNCLTLPVIHPYLEGPRYVFVERPPDEIARSLLGRGGRSGADRWKKLAGEYVARADEFLGSMDAPRLKLKYGNLTRAAQAPAEAILLARFAGLPDPNGAARAALKMVRFRS
jgi:hypothetical protein